MFADQHATHRRARTRRSRRYGSCDLHEVLIPSRPHCIVLLTAGEHVAWWRTPFSMKRCVVWSLLALLLFLFSGPAMAQSPAPAASPAAIDSQAALRRLFEAPSAQESWFTPAFLD